MAKVNFTSPFVEYTGSLGSFEIDAANIRELWEQIQLRFPELPADMLRQSAISLNGEIITRPFLESLDKKSEVIFVGAMIGG